MPAVTPVTRPVASTVAFALLLAQVPVPPSARVVVAPVHTAAVPVMAAGAAFMVTGAVVLHPVAEMV